MNQAVGCNKPIGNESRLEHAGVFRLAPKSSARGGFQILTQPGHEFLAAGGKRI
jgi:hypothetical protein